MSPAATKRGLKSRRPLATTLTDSDQNQLLPNQLKDIFNKSQHVTTTDEALSQLKKLHKLTNFEHFEGPFRDCVKKLLQSKHTIYFKISCDFLCKFLQHVSNLSDKNKTRQVSDHDKLIGACMDVADLYMQVLDESCRLNAVYFTFKFLSHIESIDEGICNALKSTLPRRVRDRKPMIRAQAVLASRTFQDNKFTQEAFLHHFERDPDLTVRKALLQIMDVKIFGHEFLVNATQDYHESMRKLAFTRLGKVSPFELDTKELHQVIHNGLNERERQASYSFRAHTLEPWLKLLYDGIDLNKLLEKLDVLNYQQDVSRLLEIVFERDLDKLEGSGATTRLHQVVESFRERWLTSQNSCLPALNQIDEKLVTVWINLAKFCKTNQANIKSIKVRSLQVQTNGANESIEKILDSQDKNDEIVELYERLTPDLVNLVDFIHRFIQHSDQVLKNQSVEVEKLEYTYHCLMEFISSYEVGDELERKTIQDVFGSILRENLLTGRFVNFILPVIKNSFQLVYSKSSRLMINYISELIQNVRSHLEDLISATQPQFNTFSQCSAIAVPCKTSKFKKVKISSRPEAKPSLAPPTQAEEQNLEFKIATIRVDLEELKDELEECVKNKDYDQAKIINNKIDECKANLHLLHQRRCSMASDVSHMTMVVETEPTGDCKLSSTMISDNSLDESSSTSLMKEDVKIFKHHTNELLKCLQMYLGCLQSVKIDQVPETMLNHLRYMTYECLDDWFKEDTRVRCLMVSCHALTALVDKEYAKADTTITLMLSAFCGEKSLEMKIAGFQGIVDVLCQHEDVKIPLENVEKCLDSFLKEYGKIASNATKKLELQYATVLVEGSTKLFYHRKISAHEILSHLIIWWYHPKTHSRLKQYIGVFLPLFVNDSSKAQQYSNDTWHKDLLAETFVTSIEYLHGYILSPTSKMAASDLLNLINFLSNLVPVSFHKEVAEKVDYRMDVATSDEADLVKYLKQSKNALNLAASTNNTIVTNMENTTLARPIQFPD